MYEKEIVIFANSVKKRGHCVAGKSIKEKKWIRPVSSDSGGELSDKTIQYKNKGRLWNVKPLDKIEIKFNKPVPLVNQPENHLISDSEWNTKYKIERKDIKDYIDNPEDLWLKQGCENDRIDFESIKNKSFKITQSLYLIKVAEVELYWKEVKKDDGNFKKQRRGKFKYKDTEYDLALTDPQYTDLIAKKESNRFLCISLGEEFNGYCYKIIASVI